jgi:pyroglutamyl-peptidase
MVIVTGFEPFGGRAANRSWQAALRVPGVERVQLPVEYARIAELVPALVARAPRGVLLVGEASRRVITLERVAKNAADPARTDNAGAHGAGVLVANAPDTLAATWDVERALAAAREVAPAELSDDAGGYCCNAALYHALRAAAPGAKIGFVHVPASGWPFAPRLARVARALAAIAATM